MEAPAFDRSRALWRRQLVLSGLALAAFAGVAVLTRLALSDWGRSSDNQAELLVGAVVLGAGVLALLGAACLHTVRIARVTFSSRNRSSETD